MSQNNMLVFWGLRSYIGPFKGATWPLWMHFHWVGRSKWLFKWYLDITLQKINNFFYNSLKSIIVIFVSIICIYLYVEKNSLKFNHPKEIIRSFSLQWIQYPLSFNDSTRRQSFSLTLVFFLKKYIFLENIQM